MINKDAVKHGWERQIKEIERRKLWTPEERAEYNLKRARQRKAFDELRSLYDDQ